MTTPSDYAAYLRSAAWRYRRSRVLRVRGRLCESCGSANSVQLHHRSYERLGHEHDDDLVILCDTCHVLVHTVEHDKHLPLAEATDLVAQDSPAGEAPMPLGLSIGHALRHLDLRSPEPATPRVEHGPRQGALDLESEPTP